MKDHFIFYRSEQTKARGHMWYNVQFNSAKRAFAIISSKAKLNGMSC